MSCTFKGISNHYFSRFSLQNEIIRFLTLKIFLYLSTAEFEKIPSNDLFITSEHFQKENFRRYFTFSMKNFVNFFQRFCTQGFKYFLYPDAETLPPYSNTG